MKWVKDNSILEKIHEEAEVVKRNSKLSYYNISASFDIETSSFYEGDEKRACMYMWGCCINGYYFKGRTWNEFLQLVNDIIMTFNVTPKLRFVFYCHNLSYEMQWIKCYFKFTDILANKKLKPIKCVCDSGIEFRCSYLLSGYSLETLADVYLKGRVEKLVGDLDYSLIRHNTSYISEQEFGYLYNDIRIVYEYINDKIKSGEDIAHIPNTKTGYVRQLIKNNCLGGAPVRHMRMDIHHRKYRQTMQRLTIGSPEEYELLNRAFQGGFTHCSCINEGKVFDDCASFDFTSSYPTCMIAYQFPMSRGYKIKIKNMEDFKHYCKCFCCVFDIKFIHLESKIQFEHYLSKSKCMIQGNCVNDNGRIASADVVFTTITNVDFEIIKECYTWDEMYIADFYAYNKGYLPTPFVKTILELYEKKTTLKGVKGREAEYQSAKENINALYGASVQKVVHDTYTIKDGEWITESPDVETEIDRYNRTFNRAFYFPWGVFITAYARYNLFFGGILNFGFEYIYADTDSCKIVNYNSKKNQKAIRDYNRYITALLKKACDFHSIPYSALSPKTIEGAKKPLGVWDFEGAGQFKALRSKCYMVKKDGKYKMTVSGVAGDKAVEYLHEKYGDDLFSVFNTDLIIPKGHTGKQTHTYIDEHIEGDVVDYMGVKGHYDEMSCVHLEDSEYHLELTDEYIQYLLKVVDTDGEY